MIQTSLIVISCVIIIVLIFMLAKKPDIVEAYKQLKTTQFRMYSLDETKVWDGFGYLEFKDGTLQLVCTDVPFAIKVDHIEVWTGAEWILIYGHNPYTPALIRSDSLTVAMPFKVMGLS